MSESAVLRWLLVGTGDIVRKRVGAALSRAAGSRLVAVCGRRLDAVADVAKVFGATGCFDNLTRALEESGANAVYVATPVLSHVEIADAALRAGKHVLVEKPLGVNAAECQSAVDLAHDSRLIAGCAYYRRCQPRFHHALDVIRSGRIGVPVLIRMSYVSWYNPPAGAWRIAIGSGGPIDDMGSHMLDLASALVGRPTRVFATKSRQIHPWKVADSCSVLADCEHGVALQANFHWSSRSWQHVLEITGTEGRLTWSPFDSGPVVVARGTEVEQVDLPAVENVHQPLIEDFVAAVRDGRSPAVPLAEAQQTTAILDAIHESVRSGAPVRL